MKTVRLNDKATMPILGLGTSQLRGDSCTRAIVEALELGYRHIDTAEMYGNHTDVGEGLRRSRVSREDIFLTSKIPPSALSHDDVLARCAQYLKELGTDYIDLLLIHWPNRAIPIAETLSAMETLRIDGRIRAIGVSNFTEHHLTDALTTSVPITVNQVELHPSFNQKDLRAYCDEKKIVLTAYAPLGRGADMHLSLLEELARTYSVSVPQVVLNWITGHHIVAIPKASSREHLEDNLKALTWQLKDSDVARIDTIPQGERLFKPASHEFDY